VNAFRALSIVWSAFVLVLFVAEQLVIDLPTGFWVFAAIVSAIAFVVVLLTWPDRPV
jgi:hypothetical protein